MKKLPTKLSQKGTENLQDDDSIFVLLSVLKNNPPPLIERMEKVDKNKDRKLNQNEFMEFLEILKISPQNIHSLCRVAGFFDGKNEIEIDEFNYILYNRPAMRDIWEKKLFKKLLKIIKSKNMDIDTYFHLNFLLFIYIF